MKRCLVALSALGLATLLIFGAALEARAESTEKTNQAWYRLHFGMGVGNASLNPDMIRIFVENEIAPRFPQGFNVEARVQGQWLSAKGLIRENNFIVNIIADDTPENAAKIKEICENYAERFEKAKASVFVIQINAHNTKHYF